MDDVLPGLEVLLPTGGAVTLLGWLVIRLALQNSADRRSYRDDLAAVRLDLQAQIDRQQKVLDDLRKKLEAERRARWKAEDDAARYRRELHIREGADDGRP